MFREIGILVKEDLSNGIDNEAVNLMINSISNLDINLIIDKSSNNKNENFTVLEHKEFVKKVDIVVVFGGDGTLLNAARKYLNYDIPILGINMGNVGFLTDISTDNFEKTIKEVLDGNYKIEERNLVSAKFGNNHLYGLNEVVIHSGAYAQLMRYRLNVNDKVVYEQRSDGLIIATPTGSTAYALSAGGPIIHPSLDVWTILPMLPQSLSSRPFVISSDEKVEMDLFDGPNENAKICVDGQDDIDIPYGEKILISKMEKTLKLVHPNDNDFFEACREKLGWSLNISKN
ncbi:MAG: NAD+ kinase [SAR86 cluster bacterium]|uniref:NAD kinase n=1 Tax=SAR86 cluster bacterium TaxID=2030880 RepID=A0A520N2E7_9GAMM|nr:MAG: NAD+ kinase [SAR86 cluster bacterium]|tara:strand:- start:1527 stop:2390 length:864 start_codon:yes stop_codon:yes gene_type:complete